MENLRWILIFAGVAILALLYFSGRGGKSASGARSRSAHVRRDEFEFDGDIDTQDPLLGSAENSAAPVGEFDDFPSVDPSDLERPGGAPLPQASDAVAVREYDQATVGHAYADSTHEPGLDEPRSRAQAAPAAASASTSLAGGLSQKIDAIGARLSGRRRQRLSDSQAQQGDRTDEPVYASKIITLHVVANAPGTQDRLFDGAALLAAFEHRDYTFGEMNIFHSMHNGKTVFSIAKMVEPGWFDPDDINSFATPGITLILQLPGPVAADTAFEVLLSEAFEIAQELDGTVLDGDRSTLSKQTAQHMREGIYEYMHRQKYFGSVAS